MSFYSNTDSEEDFKTVPPKKLPSNNKDDFPVLQGKSYEPEFHKVGKKQGNKKIYVFMISYDKNKGSQEKSTVNLLANSLKDYVEYSFTEIKNMTDNSKLIREDFSEIGSYVQWKFLWYVREEFFDELLELEEILMRTAEIYFRKEPVLDKKNSGGKIMSPIKPDFNLRQQEKLEKQQQQQLLLQQQQSQNSNNGSLNSIQNINNNIHSSNNGHSNNSIKLNKTESQQQQQQKKQQRTPEQKARHELKKKYKELMKQNAEIKEQNQKLRDILNNADSELAVKNTELTQLVEVLQIMLQSN